MLERNSLIAPSGRGILDPGTGRPLSDRYFGGINQQLGDKEYLVTATDDLIRWARSGSLMWMTFGLATQGPIDNLKKQSAVHKRRRRCSCVSSPQ
jgi:NADH-quinone oxidoreductase subunit B